MRGIPQTVSALTTASEDDSLAVLFVAAAPAHVGDIMQRMLRQFEDSAVLIYAPSLHFVIGTTHAGTKDALLDLWGLVDGTRIVPVANQTGVNLLWETTADTLGFGNLIANAYQKRSFNGLINTVLGTYLFNPINEPGVLVNQGDGSVMFGFPDLSSLENLSVAGQTVCVRFAPTKNKLTFE